MMPKCKITVLKRQYYPELAKEYCLDEKAGPCPALHEGQEFLISAYEKPEGFCEEAWCAVQRYVYMFLSGGHDIFDGTWMKDGKTMISCCNDGIRPVTLKLEGLD